MSAHQIIPNGNGFRVIEAVPSRQLTIIDGFPTRTEARNWVMTRLSKPTEIETEAWLRQRSAWRAKFVTATMN